MNWFDFDYGAETTTFHGLSVSSHTHIPFNFDGNLSSPFNILLVKFDWREFKDYVQRFIKIISNHIWKIGESGSNQ